MKWLPAGAMLPRVPAGALAIIVGLLAYAAPDQLVDILSAAGPMPLVIAVGVAMPLVAAALCHAALLGRAKGELAAFDRPLLILPLAAMILAVALAAPESQLSAVVLLVGVLVVWLGAGPMAKLGPRIGVPIYLAALLVYLACAVATFVAPVQFGQALGPLLVVMAALGLLSIGVSALFMDTRIGAIVTTVMVISLLFDQTAHDVRRLPEPATKERPANLYFALADWVAQRPDKDAYRAANRPYPVFLVTASGGGIYAAAHAYAVLRTLQAYCPRFAQHVFAASGVSGGSWGLSLFNAQLAAETSPNQGDCLPPAEVPLIEAQGDPLDSDLLSPVLATLLFVEVPDALLPGRYLHFDRAEALELAFEATSEGNGDFLRQGLFDWWTSDGRLPALNLVSTDAMFGNRFLFSPLPMDKDNSHAELFAEEHEGVGGIRVATAAGISSRFPWITPSARLVLDNGPPADARLLVDGGYFEDMAAETTLDLIQTIEREMPYLTPCRTKGEDPMNVLNQVQLEGCVPQTKMGGPGCWLRIEPYFSRDVSWSGCDVPIYLYNISITQMLESPTGWHREPVNTGGQSFLFDPLRAMLAVRSARGQLAQERLGWHILRTSGFITTGLMANGGNSTFALPVSELHLPLAWSLSTPALSRLYDAAMAPSRCGVNTPKDLGPDAKFRFENSRSRGCSAAAISDLLEPGRAPTYGVVAKTDTDAE